MHCGESGCGMSGECGVATATGSLSSSTRLNEGRDVPAMLGSVKVRVPVEPAMSECKL